jgi:hypothetical protein
MPLGTQSSQPLSGFGPARARSEDDPRAIALADTQQQAASKRPRRAPINPKLGRTLRMEIAIGSDPPPNADSSRPPTAASSNVDPTTGATLPMPASAPHISLTDQHVISGATQRIGLRATDVNSYRELPRATDPLGMAGFKTLNNPPGPGPRAASSLPPPLPAGRSAFPSLNSQQPMGHTMPGGGAIPWQAPRRRDRAGDRTIITRKGVSTRDWIFVALLVGAVGVTAGVFLSNSSDEADTASSDAATVEHTVNSAVEGEGQQAQQGARDVNDVVANVTEIVSNPPNAEVVFGGAVIGNTPVRVARASFDADYLVRIGGFHPQLVRVTSTSPATILVSLNRTLPDAPAQSVGAQDPGATMALPQNPALANPGAANAASTHSAAAQAPAASLAKP